MKKNICTLFILVCLLSCMKKTDTPNSTHVSEPRFFPIPDFSDIFDIFDYLQNNDFDQFLPDYSTVEIYDVYKASFYLGTLTADAVVATKARNKTKLSANAQAMIDYSQMVGVSDEVLMLADELLELVQDDNWEDLLYVLDEYRSLLEFTLYESNEYDLMTLLQVGAWTQGLKIMSELLLQSYHIESSSILNQKGIVEVLIKNLGLMDNQDLYAISWFKNIIDGYSTIESVISVPQKEKYTFEEVQLLFTTSSLIIQQMEFEKQ